MIREKKILQIIPALPVAYAAYRKDDGDVLMVNVAAWVLIEDDGDRYITGCDAGGEKFLDLCDNVSNFLGFYSSKEMAIGSPGKQKVEINIAGDFFGDDVFAENIAEKIADAIKRKI